MLALSLMEQVVLGDVILIKRFLKLVIVDRLIQFAFWHNRIYRLYYNTRSRMSLRNFTAPRDSQNTQKTVDFRLKYKTERCRYWFESGSCPFGQMCAFAHDTTEIRNKKCLNTHYKTKICHNFANYGYCKYGDRCQFLHEPSSIVKKQQCETRSNSVQSEDESTTSSQSKNQKKSINDFEQRHENKHGIFLEMLTDFGMDSLDIIFSGSKTSLMRRIIQEDQQEEFINKAIIDQRVNETIVKRRLYSL